MVKSSLLMMAGDFKMINAFILDCSGTQLFKDFIENHDFNLKGAIVFSEEEKQYCLKHQIETRTLEEMDFLQDYLQYLNFPLIDTFRATQRKIEFGMMRSLNSNMLIANKYYNALAYFHWFFSNFKIDCIFVNAIPHGYIPETILLDMGRQLQIPTYCLFPVTSQYSSLIRYNQMQNIPIAKPISPDIFAKQIFNKNKPSYDTNHINAPMKNKLLKQLIHRGGATYDRYLLLYQKKETQNPYGVL